MFSKRSGILFVLLLSSIYHPVWAEDEAPLSSLCTILSNDTDLEYGGYLIELDTYTYSPETGYIPHLKLYWSNKSLLDTNDTTSFLAENHLYIGENNTSDQKMGHIPICIVGSKDGVDLTQNRIIYTNGLIPPNPKSTQDLGVLRMPKIGEDENLIQEMAIVDDSVVSEGNVPKTLELPLTDLPGLGGAEAASQAIDADEMTSDSKMSISAQDEESGVIYDGEKKEGDKKLFGVIDYSSWPWWMAPLIVGGLASFFMLVMTFYYKPTPQISSEHLNLGNTRMEILYQLEDADRIPTDISRKLKKSKSTVVEHLNYLCNQGLVQKISEPGKKFVFYRLTQSGRIVIIKKKGISAAQ